MVVEQYLWHCFKAVINSRNNNKDDPSPYFGKKLRDGVGEM
jgi:hypothetical protein